jgi:hypothetical protein
MSGRVAENISDGVLMANVARETPEDFRIPVYARVTEPRP